MRIILKEDVAKLGLEGDLVTVSDGYARNYLLPRGLAVEATGGNLKAWQEEQKVKEERHDREEDEARALAQKIQDKKVKLTVKVGDGERLFGSVTTKDIAMAVNKQLKVKLDRKKIELAEPIKTLGSHKVRVKLFPGIDAEIIVELTAEE